MSPTIGPPPGSPAPPGGERPAPGAADAHAPSGAPAKGGTIPIGSPDSPGSAGERPGAQGRPRVARTDRLTTVWLCLAVLAAGATTVFRTALPQPLWTTIHLVTLGVLTNGILQWSWYFARALLRLPPGDRHSGRDNTRRILALNAALVVLIASMWAEWAPGAVVGATGVGAVAAWHGLALVVAARTRLASRFAVVLRYYAAAATFLVLAAILAGLVATAAFAASAPQWLLGARSAITVAHAIAGVGGWVGLTMGGTIVTLGPTAVRTRMDPRAVDLASLALPVWAAGLLAAVAGALAGHMRAVAAGLAVVGLAAAAGIAYPLARAAMRKGPSEYGSWSMCLGTAWILVGVAVVAQHAWTTGTGEQLRAANLPWLPIIGAGGLGQVFIGALTYLMPVVIGGGPRAVRVGVGALEAAAPMREAARNAALVLLAAATASQAPAAAPLATACWAVVLATYLADIVLMARAGTAQARARTAPPSPSPSNTGGPRG